MKILYVVRDNLYDIFGGDTIQIHKTKEYLENIYNLKIDIIFASEVSKISTNYDIIHIWGINTSPNAKILKIFASKIIISTIYWDMSNAIIAQKFLPLINYKTFALMENLKSFINYFILLPFAYIIPKYRKKINEVPFSKKYKKFRAELIKIADVLIPNSTEEGEVLANNVNLNYEKYCKKFIPIPNAIDKQQINEHIDTGYLSNIKDFVIVAAGIEPIKNQLNVLKALYNYPEIPVIFAGAIRKEHYYNKLKKIAEKRGNVYFTGKISQDDLFSLFKRSKVSILATYRESPGLSTLEALICGSQVVVSNEKFCPIRYYQFDKYGFVCNPYDIKSIKTAILNAYNNPKNIKLLEEYINFFSYENVANMTYNVYERVLSEKQ